MIIETKTRNIEPRSELNFNNGWHEKEWFKWITVELNNNESMIIDGLNMS